MICSFSRTDRKVVCLVSCVKLIVVRFFLHLFPIPVISTSVSLMSETGPSSFISVDGDKSVIPPIK